MVRAEQYRLRQQSWSSILHAAVLSLEVIIRHLQEGLALPGPDLSAGRTQLTYTATISVKGRIAILGEMVLRATAGVIIGQVTKCLRASVEASAQDGSAPGIPS